ncbi:hypothetical protein GBAR_LOCUS25320 [Geodia barretti]|uniref:Uncharacterized protein n=1 Tax=Geodia barretti TaxID=519541 RepID=A0AA35X554_GEOBA|nr:hypothetical protein GBAR_LOCUS25320 [Geodia barretti]
MDYQGTVFIESDSVSHTGASSVIRVAINPNATAGQEEFYYTFCVSYNESFTYELVACASNEGEEFQIQHTWEKNGLAQVRVGVFPNYYHGEPLGCNATSTIVAGNFGLKLGMKLHNDKQTFSKNPPPFSSSFPSSIPSPVTNSTNNSYVTGNLTFEPITELTMGSSSSSDQTTYRYIFIYDYGDNSSLEEISYFNSSHLYERPGNYSYAVEGFAVYSKDNIKAYYGLHTGIITILDPVSNLSVRFNNNNSIVADTKVYLHICANGSFPISVCWTVQPVNSSSNSSNPITTSQCPSSSNNIATCHSISREYPCPSYEMSFSEKGRYDMIVTFSNKVSCSRVVYTFHVVAAAKPPIVATTTSVGVVLAIALAVVVVLVILAVGGYLPYRRYRNHMIETADFKFIDLSERNVSAWSRFKTEDTAGGSLPREH